MQSTEISSTMARAVCPKPSYDHQEPFARTYMENDGQHPYVQFARAYAASWQCSRPMIGESELLVGVPRPGRIVASNHASGLVFNRRMCEEQILKNPKAAPELQAIRDYFDGKGVTRKLIQDQEAHLGLRLNHAVGQGATFQGHLVIDYAKILNLGVGGLRAEVEEAMDKAEGDRAAVYQAFLVYCDNMENLCRRYAQSATAAAQTASDFERKQELLEAARVCTSVAKAPPSGFHEAIQLYWFVMLLDNVDDPGRFDQYLISFYRNDIADGTITERKARRLMEELWLKMNQNMAWALVLGGVNEKGEDASNELTWLALEVNESLRLERNPAVALRVHPKTSTDLWHRAMQSLANGLGMPTLANDQAIMQALIHSGVKREDAWDYGMGGCIEFQICGKSNFGGEDGQINLTKCLELALNNGVCTQTGERMGPPTGDAKSMDSFEMVWQAYAGQVEAALDVVVAQANAGQEVKGDQGAKLYRDLLLDDCIRNGCPSDLGGVRYGDGQILTMGAIAVTDSLNAIQRMVFEKKLVSMAELSEALKADWSGHEDMRARINREAPRYGNGNGEADAMGQRVLNHCWSYLRDQKTRRGGRFSGLLVYYNRFLAFGRLTGATPDGRHSGDPLEDSVGPLAGRDRQGPTAMMRSAAQMPQVLAPGGVVLNLKLTRDLLATRSGRDKTIALIQGYFAMGGQYVQMTVANKKDLESAMREPEKWSHLMVRVGGFCARFTSLDQDAQLQILDRTGYG